MSDIEDLKQAIQHDFITPLSEFRTQVQPLDSIHDQSIEEFQRTIQALLGPSFRGAAANALTDLVRHYLATERALGDYTSNRLSEHMAQVATSCERTVAAMEPTLASLQNFPGVAAAGAVMTQTENITQEYGGPPGPENPLWDFIMVGGLAIAGGAFLWEQAQQQAKVTELWQDVQQWQANMRHLAQQTEPPLPPEPSNIIPPMNSSSGLSDAQKRLLNDVRSRLGTSPYNDAEIEALIRAGYLDPDAIAAIIRGGSAIYALFNNLGDRANIVTLMGELTPAQQQRFIALVEQYQRTHPGVTSHQIYNALRYTKMKAQAEQLANEIQTSSIAHSYPAATARLLNGRLVQYALNPMIAMTDPFTVTDGQLGVNGGGWYANITGVWAEWSRAKYYNSIGQLQDFSAPFTPSAGKPGETDIILRNGTWIEVKNVPNMDYGTSAWKILKQEVTKYINGGARHIVVELPQGLPALNKVRMEQQLKAVGNAQGVTVDVQYPNGVPFNPPADNWGNNLPSNSLAP